MSQNHWDITRPAAEAMRRAFHTVPRAVVHRRVHPSVTRAARTLRSTTTTTAAPLSAGAGLGAALLIGLLAHATSACDKPEFLMYYDTPEGKGLAGLMFYVNKPRDWGPQIGGPLPLWHYHVWAPIQCLRGEMLLVGTADEQGRCEQGLPMQRSPEMLHVWFIDRPKGPFTSSMYLPDEEVALLTQQRAVPPLRIEESLGLKP